MATVTPWEVKGNIDYDRIVAEFGTKKISKTLLDRIKRHAKGDIHHFLRRGIFFSERDMDWLLDEYEKGNPFFLYTGRGPSGKTHVGHIIPWILTKWLQDAFDVDLYFQLTDDEKFLFKRDLTLKETHEMALDNALDVIALGFNPKKTHIIIDTDCIDVMYPHALEIAKRITFSTTKAAFGFSNETNIGSIFYTAIQSVPAILPSALAKKNIPCLIPMGIDQDPHFRVGRDVLPKLGYYKPAALHCRFLPGLAGMETDGKMSTTGTGTTIFVDDDAKTIKKKINKYAFSGGQATVEEHRKLGGNPDVDVAYQWLTFFEEDDAKLRQYHEEYRSGKMLSGEMKKLLIEKLTTFLEEHQNRRADAKKHLKEFLWKPQS
jgi:tryptophanyl-tRNA synthetase